MIKRNEVNAILREEMKSFEFCANYLYMMRKNETISAYFAERGMTADYLRARDKEGRLIAKSELLEFVKTSMFTAKDGSTYRAYARKDKQGNMVQAKWSPWTVLCAIDAKTKAEASAKNMEQAIAYMKAREESLKTIEKDEAIESNKAVENAKKEAKKAAIKGAAKQKSKSKATKKAA